MKTENSNPAEEAFRRNVSDTTKWFSDAATAMAETYNKQTRLSLDVYNKFMGSALKAGKEDSNPLPFLGFDMFRKNIELFQKNIEIISSLTKEMMKTTLDSLNKQGNSTVLSKDTTDTIMETYNKQVKQMADFNKNFFEMVGKQFRTTKIDFDSLSENLQKGMESNFEVSRESIKTILESYNKQADSVLEAEKKMLGEINHQIDLITKSNLKFWSELMNAVMSGKESEKEKKEEGSWRGHHDTAKKTTAKSKTS